jgi:hypothetical protein
MAEKWRRGWDSNPRYGFPHARFRGEYFQPLSHLSAVVAATSLAKAAALKLWEVKQHFCKEGTFAGTRQRSQKSCRHVSSAGVPQAFAQRNAGVELAARGEEGLQ